MVSAVTPAKGHDDDQENDLREEMIPSMLTYSSPTSWQENWLYLAPSKHGTGWGVFAAKAFDKGDIVEVAPLFLRFAEEEPLLKETILDNYHYEYWKWNGYGHLPFTVLSFGFTLFYNHGEEQNIKYMKWGDDPTLQDPDYMAAVGYFAKRDIAVGEELLCTYGGQSWFTQRELYMVDPLTNDDDNNKNTGTNTTGEENNNPNENKAASSSSLPPLSSQLWIEDEEWRELYTSKIYAGLGKKKFKRLCQSLTDDKDKRKYYLKPYYKTRVAPWDAGYHNARTKVQIEKAGTILEIAPALIIAKDMVLNTLLEPVVLFWNDLEPESLDDEGSHFAETLRILYKDNVTKWLPRYKDLRRDDATALLPIGGSLAVLERTTSENPEEYNCRLANIMPDRWNEHAFTISIVATKPMEIGERLILKVGGISSSEESRTALWNELLETGQSLPPNSAEEKL